MKNERKQKLNFSCLEGGTFRLGRMHVVFIYQRPLRLGNIILCEMRSFVARMLFRRSVEVVVHLTFVCVCVCMWCWHVSECIVYVITKWYVLSRHDCVREKINFIFYDFLTSSEQLKFTVFFFVLCIHLLSWHYIFCVPAFTLTAFILISVYRKPHYHDSWRS